MFRLFTLIANPVNLLILRSPFHWVASGSIMVLTFFGRKSGRRYSIPVNYFRDGECVRFFSERSRRWWLNLPRGTWVKVRIQGHDYDGIAEQIPASHQRMVAALRQLYPGFAPEDYERVADNKVMFQIRLAVAVERASQKATQVG